MVGLEPSGLGEREGGEGRGGSEGRRLMAGAGVVLSPRNSQYGHSARPHLLVQFRLGRGHAERNALEELVERERYGEADHGRGRGHDSEAEP